MARPNSTLLSSAVAAALLCGCGDDVLGADIPEDIPSPNTCDSAGGGECETDSGTGVGGPCEVSDDCSTPAVCAATFDGDRGEFVCSATCISAMDEARWCSDASACCDPDATCSARGYCVVMSTTTTGTTTTDGSTGSSPGSTGSGETGNGSTGG